MPSRKENLEILESMIDQHTLSGVLGMLSEIAGLIEQHITDNWQDAALAKQWRKAELALDRLYLNTTV